MSKEGPWDLIVCSPLVRARQTAQIIADYLGSGRSKKSTT
ncbi:histidine phosphatase family protein [Arthrobacter sp. JCM 19049]